MLWCLTSISPLHECEKLPATIAQVVATVKWYLTNLNRNGDGSRTTRTLAGICRDGQTSSSEFGLAK